MQVASMITVSVPALQCLVVKKIHAHIYCYAGAAVAEPAVEVVCNDTSQKRVQKVVPARFGASYLIHGLNYGSAI